MSTPQDVAEAFLSNLGQFFVAGALSFVGWVMATFTKQHIDTMKEISQKMGTLSEDVSAIKKSIESLEKGQENTDHRVDRLENQAMRIGGKS